VQWDLTNANLGDTRGAFESQRKALAIRERLAAASPKDVGLRRDLSQSYDLISDLLAWTGDASGAFQNRRKALAIRAALSAADPKNAQLRIELAAAYEKVGSILGEPGYPNNLGDRAGAREHFQKEQAILEELVAADSTNARARYRLSFAYEHIADILRKTGDAKGALALYRKALAMIEELSKGDPTNARFRADLAYRHESLGIFLTETGDAAGALDHLRQALVIRQALAAVDSTNAAARENLAIIRALMGDALTAHRDTAGALKSYREAVELLQPLAVADPKNIEVRHNLSEILEHLAELSAGTGQTAAARSYMTRVLSIRKARADSPEAEPTDLNLYAWSLLMAEPKELRDPARALSYATRAVEMTKGTRPDLLDTQALAYHMTGDHARAVETEQKALSLVTGDPKFRGELEASLAKFKAAWHAERNR
jgi:tetratricopeptide (TPR) repeat protein